MRPRTLARPIDSGPMPHKRMTRNENIGVVAVPET
jgi:hypothetical protein